MPDRASMKWFAIGGSTMALVALLSFGIGRAGAYGMTGRPGGATGCGTLFASATGVTVQATGGAETRPLNASVNYLIKF